MFFVLYVSRDVEQANAVLKIWIDAGIGGVTILESAGMQQAGGNFGLRDDVGIIPSLATLLRGTEIHHRTLFTAITEQAMLDKVIRATEDYIGDWTRMDVGILLVLPILQAYGLNKVADSNKQRR